MDERKMLDGHELQRTVRGDDQEEAMDEPRRLDARLDSLAVDRCKHRSRYSFDAHFHVSTFIEFRSRTKI